MALSEGSTDARQKAEPSPPDFRELLPAAAMVRPRGEWLNGSLPSPVYSRSVSHEHELQLVQF